MADSDPLEGWDALRTAYAVARHGTVSGAAQELGVHHATVIRHVDALESRLGVRLFTRHARGYTPTEAGDDLMRVAHAASEQFAQLAARLRGAGETVGGDLVVTAIPDLSDLLVPALAALQQRHPDLTVRLRTDTRLFRLEYGEAHLAIRAGARPQEPDNVVQRFWTLRSGLYAAPGYLDRHRRPDSVGDLSRHRLIGSDDGETRVPFLRWLAEAVPDAARAFRCTSQHAAEAAVKAGAGIGFVARWRAAGLVEVLPELPEWGVPLWLVTHVDLHRSAKVQAALAHLKAAAEDWPVDAPPAVKRD